MTLEKPRAPIAYTVLRVLRMLAYAQTHGYISAPIANAKLGIPQRSYARYMILLRRAGFRFDSSRRPVKYLGYRE